MRHTILAIALLISFPLLNQAQENSKAPLPLKISILDESLTLPNFWFTRYSYNPAAIIGTEFILKEKEKQDWHLTANLGFYYHKDWQAAVFLNSEIGYRYHFGRFNAAARLGLGYAHVFATQPIYREEDGDYVAAKDYGSPALMPSLGLSLAYELQEKEYSPEVFLTFMSQGEVPFNFFTGLHQLVGLGVKFYPF
ncbi:MAG: hypothetical protein AAFP82_05920 [Bacteroidota bacterium]